MSEPLRYASTESVPIERVERAISVVGAVHAFACLVYVAQRSYQWFAGIEDRLATSQTPFIAATSLALQFVAALVLLLACLARACCRTRFDRWIAVSAIVLGLVWMYFGFADGFAKYVRYFGGSYVHTLSAYGSIYNVVEDLLREFNQALVPIVLAYTFTRRRHASGIGRATLVTLVPACLCYLVPPVWVVTSNVVIVGWDRYVPYVASWQTLSTNVELRNLLVELALFAVPLLAIVLLRRPWRIIAALPFAAWLIRDMVVNIPERMDRWSKLAGMDLVIAVSRNLSFVTVMSTATLLGVFVFTVAGVPKPRLFGRRAG